MESWPNRLLAGRKIAEGHEETTCHPRTAQVRVCFYNSDLFWAVQLNTGAEIVLSHTVGKEEERKGKKRGVPNFTTKQDEAGSNGCPKSTCSLTDSK